MIAHRGACAEAPENTLESLLIGHRQGADACEIDIQLSRDGHPLVIHDSGLTRTTDVETRFKDDPRAREGFLVRDFDLSEIQTLDAGTWFLGPGNVERTANWFASRKVGHERPGGDFHGNVRIPTLKECLDLIHDLKWLINIEIKGTLHEDPQLLPLALEVLARSGAAERALLSSFDHGLIARAARDERVRATAALSDFPIHEPARYLTEFLGADAYHVGLHVVASEIPAPENAPGSPRLRIRDIQALKTAGIPLQVYTVNDAGPESRVNPLIAAGIDGVFSDAPRQVLREFEARSARLGSREP